MDTHAPGDFPPTVPPSDENAERAPTVIESGRVRSDPHAETLPADAPGAPGVPNSGIHLSTSGDPAGRPFGPYRLLEELGRGAMGVVWKAWDPRLRRVVALKRVRADAGVAASGVERFAREARLAARLRHPAIVALHELGEHEGEHYFTADYIPGRPLSQRLREPYDLRLAVSWIRTVAEALDHAHRAGIVHRDIKPGNLLIDPQERPFVTDFGLAKEADLAAPALGPADRAGRASSGEPLTASGALLGTPAYMSPEQAAGAGAEVGPGSDQFSLGVVLYEALTGRLPFAGATLIELLQAIREREPTPPSRLAPHVPRDLDTVCLKALEKEPKRRYPNLGELAADLGRFLEGEPIRARPGSSALRAWRRVAKHRRLLLPVAALLAAGAALAAVLVARADAGRRAAVAGQTAAERTLAKGRAVERVLARWRELAPALARLEAARHDSRVPSATRRARAAADEPEVERFLRETPDDPAAQAAARALAGWARCRAGEEEEGLRWMREARTLDPDVPYGAIMEALYRFAQDLEALRFRGYLVTGATIESRPEVAADGAGPEAAPEAELAELLRAARAAPVWGTESAADFATALRAVSAFAAGDLAAAERDLTSALSSPDLRFCEGAFRFARARVRLLRRDQAGATADLDQVLSLRPHQAEVWTLRAVLAIDRAATEAASGGDPRPSLAAALGDLERALALAPGRAPILIARGIVHHTWAEAEAARGLDATPRLARAGEDFDAALAADPASREARHNRGSLCVLRGEEETARGREPWDTFRRARADFDALLAADPEDAGALAGRGLAWQRQGEAEATGGRDPKPSFRAALADFDAALLRRDTHAAAYSNRALARQSLAEAEAEAAPDGAGGAEGADPRAGLRAAIADAGKAIELAPGAIGGWINRARAEQKLGEVDEARGADPRAAYVRAIADLDRGLALQPAHAAALSNRGLARLFLAQANADRGADAAAGLDAARADFDAALAARPGYLSARFNRGLAQLACADLEAAAGRDARAAYARAIADFDLALQSNAALPEAYNSRGNAWMGRGQVEAARGGDARDSYRRALADFESALRYSPDLAAALNNRGAICAGLGQVEQAAGRDARPWFERAVAALEEAVRRRPGLWQSRVMLGSLYGVLGRPDRAAAALEAAARLRPDDPELRRQAETARSRAAGGAPR